MSALVGIVLVSHSAPVAAAGGPPAGGVGTGAGWCWREAAAVGRGEGGAVLVALVSGVLTGKALLAEGCGRPDGAGVGDAPWLEGSVAAMVTASAGGDLDAVEAAAVEAYDYRKA
ncbi:PTS fructose transporter subunit IIA [Streptomyces sp. SID10853]|uniref:PTS fructose transporter subunit IIA n=1 Tax=Streptomyces sp. SID10853 TaxID=2706028 RepID=UPI0013C14103|nr:PTS fructose transporter subunit IIA [Streptomyces sp. SID10853]NDZ80863.1 PTS fructose transporter subunit IIA [Streptomyces sp. SID10853]